MAKVGCLICGHVGLDPHLEILLRCSDCGFVTADLDGPLEAGSLYGGDYFTGREYLDYRVDQAFFKRTFRRRLKRILGRQPGGRLLEIGAAYGFFLDLAREHFEVVGYEVNREAARYGRETFGVDIRTENFLATNPAGIGGPFDVTVMWDVVEHLERPDLFLARIGALSAPGALLYITTGDIGSLAARVRGRKWRMIHPPTHVHYFSRDTLARLLANHGWRVIETRAVGVARSWRQVLYSLLVLRLASPRTYEGLQRIVPAGRGFTLNAFDIMEVVAMREQQAAPVSSK